MSPDPVRDSASSPSKIDLRSLFLGPKGENADVFERLLLEAFRDHVFWRRNFHPEDGFAVGEMERHTPAYERSLHVLSQELLGLLGELKAGIPFFSPRYVGHMNADLTMASLIGYFATMLYNPNNVATEASPVTTRMELEVAAQLAAMVGYDPELQWGHLTSGGTVANFEALWVARNVKYLPVALRWACEQAGCGDFRLRLASGERAAVGDLDLWQLLNAPCGSTLDAASRFCDEADDPAAAVAILGRNTLASLGYQEFGRRLTRSFGDSLPPAVILVPSTAHYSWEKIAHSLGVGGAQLVHVPVDSRFRMDTGALEEALRRLAAERRPVMACVAVLGTTEESAVDRLDRVAEVREGSRAELGLCFHLHADAAWGGYAISITRDADGSRRSYESALAASAPEAWPREGVYRALCAAELTDSITIDPHKLGWVPYPAGAILFRDRRVRELVSVEAPYLFHEGGSEWRNLGRFIFEGSKPGAAAAGVWMSHKVLPLHAEGYGRLVSVTCKAALALHRRLASGDWEPFVLRVLPTPDLNLVCFAVGHPDLRSLEQTNALVGAVYRRMSVSGDRTARQVEYFVTKTVLRAAEYGEAPLPIVEDLGFGRDDYRRAGGLGVIRCTVMNPFVGSPGDRLDFLEGFAKALQRVLGEALEEVLGRRVQRSSLLT